MGETPCRFESGPRHQLTVRGHPLPSDCAQGKTLGRKPVSARTEERIRELRGKGFGKLKIARELGCRVSTVQRVLAAA